MDASNKKGIPNLLVSFSITYLCLVISLSGYSFIGDILINAEFALEYKSIIFMYLLGHLFHIYIFGPIIILYYFIFRSRPNRILKLIFVVPIAVLICLSLYPDDYSLTVGQYNKPKQIVVYILAALTALYVNERFFNKREIKTSASWVKIN